MRSLSLSFPFALCSSLILHAEIRMRDPKTRTMRLTTSLQSDSETDNLFLYVTPVAFLEPRKISKDVGGGCCLQTTNVPTHPKSCPYFEFAVRCLFRWTQRGCVDDELVVTCFPKPCLCQLWPAWFLCDKAPKTWNHSSACALWLERASFLWRFLSPSFPSRKSTWETACVWSHVCCGTFRNTHQQKACPGRFCSTIPGTIWCIRPAILPCSLKSVIGGRFFCKLHTGYRRDHPLGLYWCFCRFRK